MKFNSDRGEPLIVATKASQVVSLLSEGFLRKKFLTSILHFLEKQLGVGLYGKKTPLTRKSNTLTKDLIKLKKTGALSHIKQLKAYCDEPFFHSYLALSDKTSGHGVDFRDEDNALCKAIGELIERHAWYYSDSILDKSVTRSIGDMDKKGLDIASLAGFSQKQIANHPSLQTSKETILRWTPCTSLITGKKIYVPTQLLSSFYTKSITYDKAKATDTLPHEPMLRWPVTTGLATGTSVIMATTKAFLEVVERDAFMITFSNKISPQLIDISHLADQDTELASILNDYKKHNLQVTLAEAPTDFPVHVILAMITDKTTKGPAFTIGASAGFDVKQLILSALSEAQSVRDYLRDKYTEEKDYTNLDKYGRIHYWAQPENLKKLDFLFAGKKTKLTLTKERFSYDKQLQLLTKCCETKNYEVIRKELLYEEIKKTNYHVVAVVVPQLQPMHLFEKIPYRGGKRLSEVPLSLGYTPAKTLNTDPHPFP